jgi:hypothetical protein
MHGFWEGTKLSKTRSLPYTPYSNLTRQHFWKTAVADLDCKQIKDVWHPKFEVTTSSRIITVGSCFAWHISKWLRFHNLDLVDSEPAPAHLTEAEKLEQGYGVFSFRTGNIYTAAMLDQWVCWSLNYAEYPNEFFLENDLFYDPFRPSIPVQGYGTLSELKASREYTLECIRKSIRQADTFIFTLGLTEAWINNHGDVYPMCPGTVRGKFEEKKHYFKNFSSSETYDQLTSIIDKIKSINKDMRFILTVSPVPLTATYTKHHVLVATAYSKSVLRAVAGQLANERADLDYFPSFELISSFPFRGQFFKKNLRTVEDEGVAFVMEKFRQCLSIRNETGPIEVKMPEPKIANLSEIQIEVDPNLDELCDDILLENWSSDKAVPIPNNCRICLIGDSHMGRFSAAFTKLGVEHAGGGIMNGSAWHLNKFALDEACYFLPYENLDSQKRWIETYEKFFRNGISSDAVLVTNIGMHSHVLFYSFFNYLTETFKKHPDYATTIDDVINYLKVRSKIHLNLLKSFDASGLQMIWVTDPPFQHLREDKDWQNFEGTFRSFDTLLGNEIAGIGARIFNVRDWVSKSNQEGLFLSTEHDDKGNRDWIHGSDRYYEEISSQILALI